MTCIIGMVGQKGKVYVGGDSFAGASWDKSIRLDEKVFKKKGMVFGFTASYRMGQLLRYSLKIPKHPKGMDTYKYMVTKFIDSVRKCFEDGGFEEDATFIVGYAGKIFTIYSDFQVAEDSALISAVGCGGDIARGAMDSIMRYVDYTDPFEIIEMALDTVTRFSAGVSAPFHVIGIDKHGKRVKR